MTKKQSSSERTAHEERHHCPAARDQGTPEELDALAEDELRALVRTLQSECELLRAEQDRLTPDLQSLTEQHELLEQAEVLSRTGAWSLDLVTGESGISENWRRILGFDSTTISWDEFRSLIPEEDLPSLTEAFDNALAGAAPYETEHRIITRSDGETLHIHCRGEVVRAKDGCPLKIFGVSQDITERKLAEAALAESETMMRYIIKHDPNALAVYDEHLHYIAVSDRYLTDYDIAGREVIGRHLYEVFPDTPQWWKEVHQRVLRGAIERNDDDRFERPDGSITYNRWECRPWYRADATIGGMITYTEVTTDRRLAEIALRTSEERYRYALEATREGIWDWNIPSGIVEWTPRCYEMLEFEVDEFIVTFDIWNNLLHPDDAEQTLQTVNAQIRSGGAFTAEFRLRTRTGSYQWVLGRGRTVEWDDDGNPVRMIGTHVDITERKELEDRLRHAEKMEAIGQLAGGIAHDFNNQLASIMGFADLLTMQLPDGALQRYAQGIVTSAQRSAELTRQLLAYARKADYQSVPVDVHAVISDVADILRHSIDRRITIEEHLDAAPSTTRGDPNLLLNAILNLAINARDAMPDGGTLAFRTSVVELDGPAGDSLQLVVEPGRHIRIDIEDTGTGIPEEILDRIFEPFFTTKEVGQGTGMGLAAVYGTLSQHEGGLYVESQEGVGSMFSVFLPLIDSRSKPAPRAEMIESAPRHARILVVDDETQVRDVAAQMLRSLGYDVVTAEDGSSALAYYREHVAEVDLVLLDLVMPKMNGTETYQALRTVTEDVTVLLTSGFSVNGAAQHLLDQGADGFLQKPFSFAELSRKVAELVAR